MEIEAEDGCGEGSGGVDVGLDIKADRLEEGEEGLQGLEATRGDRTEREKGATGGVIRAERGRKDPDVGWRFRSGREEGGPARKEWLAARGEPISGCRRRNPRGRTRRPGIGPCPNLHTGGGPYPI